MAPADRAARAQAAVAAPPAAPAVVAVVTREPVKLARARAELLCDPGTFHPHRTAVGDGVIAGSGKVGGRPVYVWAQDGTFKGGSLGAAGGETIVRTIEMAERAWAPVVGFPHSGGARLQEGVAALAAYAAIFRAQARSDALQISVIGGPCAGGGAYSPALGDLVMMAGPESRMFLTGPKIIERVTREIVTAEELGGPKVHAKTGVSHLDAVDDVAAGDLVRNVLAHLPGKAGGALPLAPPREPPAGDPSRQVPRNQRKVYDVRDVIRHLIDGGELLELAPKLGAQHGRRPGARRRAAGRRRRQPAQAPRRHARCRRRRQGRVVRGLLQQVRAADHRARRHAGVPTGGAPGARGGPAARRQPAARVRRFDSAARDRYPEAGVRRCAHRHELPRPRTRPHVCLAQRQDRCHGRDPGDRDHGAPRAEGRRRSGGPGAGLRGRAPARRRRGHGGLRRRDRRAVADARADLLRTSERIGDTAARRQGP